MPECFIINTTFTLFELSGVFCRIALHGFAQEKGVCGETLVFPFYVSTNSSKQCLTESHLPQIGLYKILVWDLPNCTHCTEQLSLLQLFRPSWHPPSLSLWHYMHNPCIVTNFFHDAFSMFVLTLQDNGCLKEIAYFLPLGTNYSTSTIKSAPLGRTNCPGTPALGT